MVPDESPAVLPDQHPGGIAPDPLDAAGTTADRGQAATPADVAEADPCAAEARIAEERCALADRLRALLDVAQTELRLAQRAFDLHERQLDRAIATADPRVVRERKDAAYAAFRTGRAGARSRGDLEVAATIWLEEIDRVNRDVAAARRAATEARRDAGRVVVELEKRSVAVDAARIAADRATRACVEARDRLAGCHEIAGGGPAPGLGEILGSRTSTGREAWTPAGADLGAEGAGPGTGLGAAALGGVERHPAIVALLGGDVRVQLGIATQLGGDDEAAVARWADRLDRLTESIVDVTLDDSHFVFPRAHPFWGGFSQAECREVAVALAALGYRPRPGGGWIDDRIPTRRDLSLAVGYAGHDPVRLRNGPADDDIARLFDGTETNVVGHLVEVAGGLTLGEMVAMLGRRAEGLTDLWEAWGRVRPLLLREAGDEPGAAT